ncbi:TniQ family protein [Caballeronia sp. EK]|uniref:TniQ family protein n=1 Tax=Caballeronia sp. EK TaxID=2767469 RepID=UPI001655F39A|nr:TniQ family protein [Caballeronia sp. EK]MBC8642739.1 TniQ family protein [Caballeronia sp. EK]
MKSPFRTQLPGGWPDEAPARSILFSLPPYGCSGEDRESLGSYICRLSDAQDIPRGALASRIVGPVARELFGADPRRLAQDIGRADYAASVSSQTEEANHWAYALNSLTLRNNLQLCTLLPLRNLVSPLKLMSSDRQFCPYCYKEDEQLGRSRYDRLLWSIKAVVACPLHRARLVKRLEQKRDATLPDDADTLLAQGKLSEVASMLPASEYEIESARLIAELLDDAVFFSGLRYESSAQSTFLVHAIDSLFAGKSAQFAVHLGVGKSQVHGWVKGKVRMSLPRLALTAYCCNCAIADILLGNRVLLSQRAAPECQDRRLLQAGGTGAKRPKDELRSELGEMIRAGATRSAAEAAKAVGISVKFFRKEFPSEHAAAVQQGRDLATALRDEARATYDQLYLAEHLSLQKAGIYPARRRVVSRMRGMVKTLGRHQDAQRAQLKAHAATGVRLATRGRRPSGGPGSQQQENRV